MKTWDSISSLERKKKKRISENIFKNNFLLERVIIGLYWRVIYRVGGLHMVFKVPKLGALKFS